MAACTFFGHRDTDTSIQPLLQSTIMYLIKEKNVNTFYVGNNGGFDNLVKKTLKIIKTYSPNIQYFIVIPYMPKITSSNEDYSNSIFPTEVALSLPKYAIPKRNIWMIDKSDYVITFVKYNSNGAYKYKVLSEKKGKSVINLCNRVG